MSGILAIFASAFLAAFCPSDTLPEARTLADRRVIEADTISSRRLEEVGGVASALRFTSGVQIRDYGGAGGLKTLNVRSLGSEYTSVFIDGVQVDNAQNAQVDLGRFSTFALSGMELSSAGGTGLQPAREYGAAASLHLHYKAPAFATGSSQTFKGRVSAGSSDLFNPSLYFGFKVSPKLSAAISAEYLTSDGKYRYHAWRYVGGRGYDTTMTRQNADISSLRLATQVFGRGRGSWNVRAEWFDSDRGLPGPVVRRSSGILLSGDRQSDRDLYIQGSWARSFGKAALKARAKYANAFLRYSDFREEDPSQDADRWRYRQQNAYASVSLSYSAASWLRLRGAADLLYSTLEANTVDFSQPERYAFFAALAADASPGKVRASASLLWTSAADRFDGAAGAAGATGATGGAVVGTAGFGRENKTMNRLSPAIELSWQPLYMLRIEAFAKASCRLPTFNDLYYTVKGSSRLKPETAIQYDLVASCGSLSEGFLEAGLRAETYLNEVKDKLIAVPTYSQFRWSMLNLGKVRSFGAILGGNLRHKGRLSFRLDAKYHFQRSLDLSHKGTEAYRGQVAYIPWSSGSLSAEAGYEGWRLDWNLIWDGRRYSSSANLPEYRLAAWHTSDLWLSKDFKAKGADLCLRLEIRNLSGERYSVVPGYPMPGRQAFLTLQISY